MANVVETIAIDPALVVVADRLCAVDNAWVEAIAASIEQKGQSTPITVRRGDDDRLHLVAGAHRVFACLHLNIDIRAEVITCDDLEARLIEIDENLFRHELRALDRAVFLAERKAVYEEMHPETKRGVAGGKSRQGSARDILSFAESTQKRTGLTRKTIDRAITIAKGIPTDLRAKLAGTILADRQVDLLLLADLPEARQRQAVALVTGGAARTVKDALMAISGTATPATTPEGRQYAALERAWSNAGPTARTRFLTMLHETGELEGDDA